MNPPPQTSELFPYTTLFRSRPGARSAGPARPHSSARVGTPTPSHLRSEEHTSELQSRFDLVCRLLLEKKKRGRGGSSALPLRGRDRGVARRLPTRGHAVRRA